MKLLQELFKIREEHVIDPPDVESVVDDFKFALLHIKTKSDDLDFDSLVDALMKELSLSKKEAAVIANLLK